MRINTDTISLDELEKGDTFLVRTLPGDGKAKLRGKLSDPEGNEIGDCRPFRLWAGNGTKLDMTSFPNVVPAQLFMKGNGSRPRAKILSQSDKKGVFQEFLWDIGYRRGKIEYDSPFGEADREQIEIEKDIEYTQADQTSREAGEDTWTEEKSSKMRDLNNL